MMEFRETGLPLDDQVFKAFFAWRTNAKDFAEKSGLSEQYPLQVAQVAQAADSTSTEVMTLAMLMAVPETAWGAIEKRFGARTVEKLGEAWKHVHTGYAYIDEASEEVKALAMGAAIVSFNSFIDKAAKIGEAIAMAQMGQQPGQVFQELLSPQTKMYDRMGDKLGDAKYETLKDAYFNVREEYRAARKEQNAALAEMGFPGMDDDEEGMNVFRVPFEMSGLYDAPEVRKAYRILQGDARVDESDLAKALSVGRLMSDVKGRKDANAIAAGILDAGIARRGGDDTAFLSKKLAPEVMGILENYDLKHACMQLSPEVLEAPPGVRQAAVANGIVLLDFARQNGEGLLQALEAKAARLPRGADAMLKAKMLQPLQALVAMVTEALEPLMNRTGAPQLEQILIEEVRHVREFVAEHMPGQPQGDGGRIVFRRLPPPGTDYGM